MYYCYIVRCSDNSLYCGIAQNLEKRIAEHNARGPRGAKYTRARQPVTLVWYEAHQDRSSAMKREAEVKKWDKKRKEEAVISFSK